MSEDRKETKIPKHTFKFLGPVAGALGGAKIGGVGVVAMGTGIGIPVLGVAGACALGGYMVGKFIDDKRK